MCVCVVLVFHCCVKLVCVHVFVCVCARVCACPCVPGHACVCGWIYVFWVYELHMCMNCTCAELTNCILLWGIIRRPQECSWAVSLGCLIILMCVEVILMVLISFVCHPLLE